MLRVMWICLSQVHDLSTDVMMIMIEILQLCGGRTKIPSLLLHVELSEAVVSKLDQDL